MALGGATGASRAEGECLQSTHARHAQKSHTPSNEPKLGWSARLHLKPREVENSVHTRHHQEGGRDSPVKDKISIERELREDK